MYRSYYSYKDMPQMIRKDEPIKCDSGKPNVPCKPQKQSSNKILGNFETDDVILAVVIAALLSDNGGDNLLLIVLAIIFFAGIE